MTPITVGKLLSPRRHHMFATLLWKSGFVNLFEEGRY